jgi:hypothetical protein
MLYILHTTLRENVFKVTLQTLAFFGTFEIMAMNLRNLALHREQAIHMHVAKKEETRY